jgi:DNA-binding NarL/FixJ family response regulator
MRIMIFEDNHKLRSNLKLLFSNQPGWVVVGEYDHCNTAAADVSLLKPDIVIMDIEMPGVNGIGGVKIVKEIRPETQVIMFTVFEDSELLFQCLCAGASGYLLKRTSADKLIEAIYDVSRGGSAMSPEIARKVMQFFHQPNIKAKEVYDLSLREREILQWLVKGYSNKLIASECNISIDTVKTHLRNIYVKLQVSCGKEAVAKAVRNKIV